jgi:hypothetical protein
VGLLAGVAGGLEAVGFSEECGFGVLVAGVGDGGGREAGVAVEVGFVDQAGGGACQASPPARVSSAAKMAGPQLVVMSVANCRALASTSPAVRSSRSCCCCWGVGLCQGRACLTWVTRCSHSACWAAVSWPLGVPAWMKPAKASSGAGAGPGRVGLGKSPPGWVAQCASWPASCSSWLSRCWAAVPPPGPRETAAR